MSEKEMEKAERDGGASVNRTGDARRNEPGPFDDAFDVSPINVVRKRANRLTKFWVGYFVFWLFAIYWLPHTSELPEIFGTAVDLAKRVIPSINGLATNSPNSGVAVVFLALHWWLVPVYIWINTGLMDISRFIAGMRVHSSSKTFLLFVFLAVAMVSFVMLPASIDPNQIAITGTRGFKALAHDFLWATALVGLFVVWSFSFFSIMIFGLLANVFCGDNNHVRS